MNKQSTFNAEIPCNNAKFRRQTWELSYGEGDNIVGIEIVRWKPAYGDEWKWNYYIQVPASRLKEPEAWEPKFNPEEKSWNQWNGWESRFHDIYFHGGVTFCQTVIMGNYKQIKVGCDYSHYNDFPNMDDYYDEVFLDAERTAKEFLDTNPYKSSNA